MVPGRWVNSASEHGTCHGSFMAHKVSTHQEFSHFFPCSSTYLISHKSQTANPQLLIRPCTFKKYFSTCNRAAVLKYWQFHFKCSFSSCSHELYLSVSPSGNKFNSGGLTTLSGRILLFPQKTQGL
jgi:hypothetical protein